MNARTVLASALACAALLGSAPVASADGWDLDGSFGTGGVALGPPRPPDTSLDDGLGSSYGTAVAIDSEDRVIAAGLEDVQVGAKYRIASRAADAAGNNESQTSANLRRVRLR